MIPPSTAPSVPDGNEIRKIHELPKMRQGDEIARVIDVLIANGRSKQDAFAEMAEALGMKSGTIAAGYYRRQRAKGGGRGPRVAAPDTRAPAVKQASANGASHEMKELMDLIERMVERRVAARLEVRLAEVRKALG